MITKYSITYKGELLVSHHVRKGIRQPEHIKILSTVMDMAEASKESLSVIYKDDLQLHLNYLVACDFLKETKS